MRFSNEFIEQVRQANDIVSVISDYVTLTRRGRNFWACCPFHNERTASFSVAPEKGFFYCFGCHASGDVFKFVMMKENISFTEAVERLAERAHIPLPAVERSAAEKERDELVARLYRINEMAGNFFHNCLTKTHYGVPGLDYLHRRQLRDETIVSFKLGFAPDSWDKLTTAFRKKGVAGSDLVLLGLSKEKNGHFYDAFRNRVIFPIRDGRGRIVGFGGRVLDDSKPKYLNSPDTPVFNKRRLLFAMDQAHQAIYEAGKAVLVEGYMDVISCHNQGVKNVVASLGTAFTPEQARLLQRQAKELVLSYDMDGAGRQATVRAMEIVRGLGLQIRVASLPQGKDPDEYINSAGAAKFREAIDNAPNVLDYTLQRAMLTHDSATLEGKSAITAAVWPVLAGVDNQVVLDAFLSKLAVQLRIDENAVRSEFNRYVAKHPETGQKQVTLSPTIGAANAAQRGAGTMAVAEENILRFLLEHPGALPRIRERIHADFFMEPKRRRVYETIAAICDSGQQLTPAGLQAQLSTEEAQEVARIMVLQDVPVDEAVLLDYAKRFRLQELKRQYEQHSTQAAQYGRTQDPRLAAELAILKRIRDEMKQWA